MMSSGPKATPLTMCHRVPGVLKRLVRRQRAPFGELQRARVLLLAPGAGARPTKRWAKRVSSGLAELVPTSRPTTLGSIGRDVLEVDGQDREVQGLLLMRPKVLRDPAPTIFVSMVGRGLGWLSLIVILCIMPMMFAGRVLMFVRRRRAKVAEKRITTKVPK